MSNTARALTLLAALLLPCAALGQAAPADKSVTLRLTDGSVLVGEIVDEKDGKVRVRTQNLGEVVVEASAISERSTGPAKVEAAPPPAAAPLATAVPAAGVSWTRTFGVGGSYASAPFIQGPVDGSVPNISGKDLHLPGSQWNAQAALTLLRTTATRGWYLNSTVTYMDAQPTGRLAESYTLETNLTSFFRANDYTYERFEFNKDAVRHVNDNIVLTFGVGRRLINQPHVRLDILPGINFRRQSAGTPYDGDLLVGYGAAELLTWSNTHGFAIEQRVILRSLLQHSDLWSTEFHIGAVAPITKKVALTVGVTHTYDRMLGIQKLNIPANSFFPGSPAAFFLANNKSNLQITTGVQVKF